MGLLSLEDVVRFLRRRPGVPWFPDQWGILDPNNTENRIVTNTPGGAGGTPTVALAIPLPEARSVGMLVMVQARRPSVPATGSFFQHASYRRETNANAVLVGVAAVGAFQIVEAPYVGTEITFGVSADGKNATVIVTAPVAPGPPPPTTLDTWTVRALLFGTDQ